MPPAHAVVVTALQYEIFHLHEINNCFPAINRFSMKRILVPTDFSVNSKGGIRFAIHWALQQSLELTFIHVLHTWKLTSWTEAYFLMQAKKEEIAGRTKLEKFISGIYQDMKVGKGKHSFVIIRGISADISILEYCQSSKVFDFICMSTRGAGKLNRIIGTNTGNLITKSKVPVLAVPKGYRASHIKSVLYATDLRNYTEEIKKVISFASPFQAAIEVLHFMQPDEINFNKKTADSAFKKPYKYSLHIAFEKSNAVHSLVQNLQHLIKLKKPSVVIMFTNQKRNLFQKIFLSSKSEELSFQLKVPLLVFSKF